MADFSNMAQDPKRYGAIIGLFKYIFSRKERENKQKANTESHAVQALKRQIKLMEDSMNFMEDELNYYRELARERNEQSMQDKILDTAVKFFTSGNQPQQEQAINHNLVESGQILTDDQIRELIQQIPTNYISIAKTMPADFAVKTIKQKFPNISNESILKGLEMIKNEN